MALNSLLACDSWYHFSYPFSWSNDCEVAQLLADIPFISVGILAFGVSPLFLAMKRISLSTIWLLFSILLAFIAAVLDLGEILAHGVVTSMALRAREVLFALSVAFRFLFYWSYVAEPPRKVLSTQGFQTIKFLTLESTHEPHSGSWVRWGLPGKLFGVGFLAPIMAITALQILWRVVPRFHQYSSVYATDTALELLISFLLLLKLLLNTLTLNSPDNMPVHTFRECLAPISGLLVNITLGVGNLLSFAFTESTVGRLLQALEIYIVVVFVMVIAFLRHSDILLSAPSSQRKKRRDFAFTLPEPIRRSTFRITPPLVETPRMSMILGATSPNKQPNREAFHRTVRRSLNHVSSWVSSRVSRNRLHYEDDEAKLWNAEKARKVKVDPPYTGDIDTELRASVMSTQEPKEWAEFAHDASPNHMSIMSALDAQSAGARSMEDAIQSSHTLHPSRVNVPQRTNPAQVRTSSVYLLPAPLASSSGTKRAGGMATPKASPVYSAGGSQSLASLSDSRTSLDELLRQQSQLDQSIEALKLFSTRSSSSSSYTPSSQNVDLSRSPSTGQRTVSSDVSLSNFPIPPWLETPVPPLPSSRPSSVSRIRGGKRVRLAAALATLVQDTDVYASSKASTSLADMPSSPYFESIPNSPCGEENESVSTVTRRKPSRSDSEGMQYNVTSFIGNLATPGEPPHGAQEKPWWPTENDRTSPGMGKFPRRMLPVPPRLEGLPSSPAVAKRSPLVPSSIRSGSRLVREPGLPMTASTEGVNQAERTFVRPRPLPITIHPYREQDTGTLRVQVLLDE